MKSQSSYLKKIAMNVIASLACTNVLAAETANVLPNKVSRARLIFIQTSEIAQKLDANGESAYYSDSLNRSISTRDMAAHNAQLQQLAQALDQVQPGLSDQLLNTNLYSDFSSSQSVIMPAYEYGYSENLSFGIRIPIVRRKVDVSFKAVTVNNGSAIGSQLGSEVSPALYAGLAQLSQRSFNTDEFANLLFQSKGYERPASFEKTELGDIEIGAKYNFYKGKYSVSTAQLGFRLPTGTTPSQTNIFDTGSGEGSYASQISYFQDLYATPSLIFNGTGKLTGYMPDTRDRAVPKDSSDTLPSLRPEDGQVQSVTRNRAPEWFGEVSSTFFFVPSTSAYVAYQKTYQNEDHYSGNGNLYYAGLSKDTNQDKNAYEIGMTYSTLPAFRKTRTGLPLEISGLYNSVFSGKNSTLVDYGRIDLMLYF